MSDRGKLFNLTMALLVLQPFVPLQLVGVVYMWFVVCILTPAIIAVLIRASKVLPTWRPKPMDTAIVMAQAGAAVSTGWVVVGVTYGVLALTLIYAKLIARGYAHP